MKLRNKKTGGLANILADDQDFIRVYTDAEWHDYDSVAEMMEEWEDYEEPKDFWYIEPNGVIARIDEWDCCTDSDTEIMKTLGNYFESEEEAKQAVEKLKAYKRLKDKGFKFTGYGKYHWTGEEWPHIAFSYPNFDNLFDDKQTVEDLDLLFGCEE